MGSQTEAERWVRAVLVIKAGDGVGLTGLLEERTGRSGGMLYGF